MAHRLLSSKESFRPYCWRMRHAVVSHRPFRQLQLPTALPTSSLVPWSNGHAVNDAQRQLFGSSPTKKARRRRDDLKQTQGENGGVMKHFTVALVGRPNVGKSSLFNRLAGKRIAITHDQPGTTRDVKEGEGSLAGMEFSMMDTGGLEYDSSKHTLGHRMLQHTIRAIQQADVIVFALSARDGIAPEDEQVAKWLHDMGRASDVILIANKAESMINHLLDDEDWLNFASEAYRLGLGDPIPISAEHGDGMNSLFDAFYPYATGSKSNYSQRTEENTAAIDGNEIFGKDSASSCVYSTDTELIGEDDELHRTVRREDGAVVDQRGNVVFGPSRPTKRGVKKEELLSQKLEKPINVAIVGRPNVGKSTLLNKLIDDHRVLTGPEAGLTRDSTEVRWNWKNQDFRLVDTAGMRKVGTFDIRPELEGRSVSQAKRALALSNVTILVVDSEHGLTKQDINIASEIVEEGRALVLALNKSDSVSNKRELRRRVQYTLDRFLPDCKGIEVEHMSALDGTGVSSLMPAVMRIFERWNLRIPTGYLNRWLRQVCKHHPPPAKYKQMQGPRGQGKSIPIKLKFFSQINVRPPTFALFANRTDLPAEYMRLLTNAIRQEFGLYGVPIRLLPRTSNNPYTASKSKVENVSKKTKIA